MCVYVSYVETSEYVMCEMYVCVSYVKMIKVCTDLGILEFYYPISGQED